MGLLYLLPKKMPGDESGSDENSGRRRMRAEGTWHRAASCQVAPIYPGVRAPSMPDHGG